MSTPTLRCEIIPVTLFQQNCSLVWDTSTMRGALEQLLFPFLQPLIMRRLPWPLHAQK